MHRDQKERTSYFEVINGLQKIASVEERNTKERGRKRKAKTSADRPE